MRNTFNTSLRLFMRTIPFALILIGIFYLLLTRQVAADSMTPINYAKIAKPTQTRRITAPTQTLPVRITITDLTIDLNIKQGAYDKTTHGWNIDSQNAYLAIEPATPIIYAHNRPSLFYALRNVKNHTIMTLHHSDGTAVHYSYVKTRFVTPDDGSVLTEANSQTVILLTCSGLFDESRRIVYFREQS